MKRKKKAVNRCVQAPLWGAGPAPGINLNQSKAAQNVEGGPSVCLAAGVQWFKAHPYPQEFTDNSKETLRKRNKGMSIKGVWVSGKDATGEKIMKSPFPGVKKDCFKKWAAEVGGEWMGNLGWNMKAWQHQWWIMTIRTSPFMPRTHCPPLCMMYGHLNESSWKTHWGRLWKSHILRKQ